MLCIKLHPPNIENAPPLNRSCTPSEPKLHPLNGFLSKLESFATIQLIACAVGCIFLTSCLQEGETADKMYADRETILAMARSGKFVPCSYLERLFEFC